jgi:hypothetical protein
MWEGEFVRHRKFLSKSEEQFSKNSSKTERVGDVVRDDVVCQLSLLLHVRTRTGIAKIEERNISIWQWHMAPWLLSTAVVLFEFAGQHNKNDTTII